MPLSDADVLGLVESEWQESLGSDISSQLRSDRQKALSYYEGDMTDDLPDPVDRSKAVSTDVADTVEGLMPGLIEIFCSGDEVVVFNPVNQRDVEAAQQETDYCNYVVFQQNNGFLTVYTFGKDGLLSKVGVVKAWWEEREDETKETYRGITDDELALLAADDEIEIVEQTTYPMMAHMEQPAEGLV